MKKLPLTLAICASILAACATPPKASLPAGASPQAEIENVNTAIQEASRKQYDQLAPKHFEQAVEYRNAAREKMGDQAPTAEVLEDVAIAKHAIQEVERIGAANASSMQAILDARAHAVQAEAHKLQEKSFRKADNELSDFGRDMEKGKFTVDAEEISDLQRRYSEAEIESRKISQLGAARSQIEKAEDESAKKRTPALYEQAKSQLESAEQAIAISPHDASGYASAVNLANESARKLNEVLFIATAQDASEEVALTIWTQNQALEASKAALVKAETEAQSEQANLQSKVDETQKSLSALQTENKEYASDEQLKQRIEEIRKQFSPEEAEVMKEGNKIVVRLKQMQFTTGRSELKPDSYATLKKVEDLISAVPATQVVVEGHTDSSGSNQLNRTLSMKRAENVKKYLESQGLAEDLRIEALGRGAEKPITTNKTKAGRAANRRVDVVIETPTTL